MGKEQQGNAYTWSEPILPNPCVSNVLDCVTIPHGHAALRNFFARGGLI